MRIAILSPLYESVPPKLYGGTERVVANLVRGLTEMGHEVTLFASGDSRVPVELVSTVPHALRLAPVKSQDPAAFHLAMLGELIRRRDDFDVVHSHVDYLGFPLAASMALPIVSTMHGRLDFAEIKHVLGHYRDVPLVSISDHQRLPAPDQNWVATVYHGLPMDTFEYREQPGAYLAFLGRMSVEKRPDLAIDIARLAGIPLKMAAKVDTADAAYFEAVVKPKIDGRFIEYVGEIAEHEKSAFLGNALGMVFPIDWPEPFGLAPVEAWACGTPVLARPCGSVPELHADGITGFVRETPEDLAALACRLSELDRGRVRAYAERNFSLQRMCEDYVNVYLQLQGGADKDAEAVQLGQPDDHRWGVLYPV
jgi:glycosyltransferase involved in cell wall biosynthesis